MRTFLYNAYSAVIIHKAVTMDIVISHILGTRLIIMQPLSRQRKRAPRGTNTLGTSTHSFCLVGNHDRENIRISYCN